MLSSRLRSLDGGPKCIELGVRPPPSTDVGRSFHELRGSCVLRRARRSAGPSCSPAPRRRRRRNGKVYGSLSTLHRFRWCIRGFLAKLCRCWWLSFWYKESAPPVPSAGHARRRAAEGVRGGSSIKPSGRGPAEVDAAGATGLRVGIARVALCLRQRECCARVQTRADLRLAPRLDPRVGTLPPFRRRAGAETSHGKSAARAEEKGQPGRRRGSGPLPCGQTSMA